jgi:hypothetical protein
VWWKRIDATADAGERDRIADDATCRLMVGVPHAAGPASSPRQHAVRPDLRDLLRYLYGGVTVRDDGGIGKVQESGLDSEKIAHPGGEHVPPLRHLVGWNPTEGVRRFAASQPYEHDAIPPRHLAGDGRDRSYFVIRMGQGDEKRASGSDRRRPRHNEAAASSVAGSSRLIRR